jgi:hypothetical protein
MSVKRSNNTVNQQRIDCSYMRSIESAVRADFDDLLISLATGEGQSYIIRGFTIDMGAAIGSSASGLQLIVSNASLLHQNSDEAGTFFTIPTGTANEILNSTTNTKVDGSFIPSTLNYVGIEFTRAVDDTTLGQVFLWNPVSKTEFPKTVPLAITLDYKIVVSSSIWASNVLPISIIETDSANNVISVTDDRPLLFRLGTAGYSTPNPFHNYPWNNDPEGRTENHYQSTTSTSPFRGGDKQILHLKEWVDAIMTEFKALKGTPHWFDLLPNISIENLYADLANLQMTGRGRIFHSSVNAGQLNWDRDMYLRLIGSRLSFRIKANLSTTHITLDDGQVAYLDLNRQVDVIPNLIFTNASPTVSSVGSVPWTSDVLAGDFVKLTYAGNDKYYQILSVDSNAQVTLTENYAEVNTGSLGAQAQYTWGSYETNASPSTKRHIKIADRKDVPLNGNVYWLFFRDDNGSAMAKAYVRSGGGPGEIEQGESIEVSDTTAKAVFDYIGSYGENDSNPNYAGAIDTQEVTQVEVPPQSDLSAGQCFSLSAATGTNYAIYYTFNGVGTPPSIPAHTNVQVDLSTVGDTEAQVATKTQAVLNAMAGIFTATVSHNVVSIQDANNGTPSNAYNITMGGAFYITIPTEGDVSTKFNQQNYNTVDGENLTRRAARLTAMIADKAQDKTIGFLEDYKLCIKSTNGVNQELLFANSDELGASITPYLNIGIPSSTYNGTVTLTGGPLVLAANQVAYIIIDRNASFSFTLATVSVSAISACPLNENVFVIAYRLSDTRVWLWNGRELLDGNNPSMTGITDILEAPVYEEPIAIIAGVPSTDNELQGPISAGTVITLPTNSRNGDLAQGYIVGSGVLVIELNGMALKVADDWSEIGSVGASATTIQIDIDLVIGDELNFRIDSTGGYIGVGAFSSGEANDGVNLGTGSEVYSSKSGVHLQFRTLKQGANIALSQDANEITVSAVGSAAKIPYFVNNADYVVTDVDGYDVLLVTTGNTDRTITLPTIADNYGRTLIVKKVDSGTGFVNIRAELTEEIDGLVGATYSPAVNQCQSFGDAFSFFSPGSGVNWYVV